MNANGRSSVGVHQFSVCRPISPSAVSSYRRVLDGYYFAGAVAVPACQELPLCPALWVAACRHLSSGQRHQSKQRQALPLPPDFAKTSSFEPSASSCNLAHRREKEMRHPICQQDRCQKGPSPLLTFFDRVLQPRRQIARFRTYPHLMVQVACKTIVLQ